jgi:transposase-like protein
LKLNYKRTHLSQLAGELCISTPQLYKCSKEHEEFGQVSFPGNSNVKQTLEQERIAELLRKLKDVEVGRDTKKQ